MGQELVLGWDVFRTDYTSIGEFTISAHIGDTCDDDDADADWTDLDCKNLDVIINCIITNYWH